MKLEGRGVGELVHENVGNVTGMIKMERAWLFVLGVKVIDFTGYGGIFNKSEGSLGLSSFRRITGFLLLK